LVSGKERIEDPELLRSGRGISFGGRGVVLDRVGFADDLDGNAWRLATKGPCLDAAKSRCLGRRRIEEGDIGIHADALLVFQPYGMQMF
jgi:hypothetical protein